jgi:hypothetical protein
VPRIRSVKPEYWGHFPTAQLSRDARLLYIALWNFADEHARLAGDPRFVKGQVFPYDDDLAADSVAVLLDELEEAGKIVRYTTDGAPFIFIPSLASHQRLEPGKVPSRHPDPPPPGAGKSARGADSSAPNPDIPPVDNRSEGSDEASSQVSDPSQTRADESARDADSSALLYGAGSREHAAGGIARELPPPLAILRSKLNARRLVVRWDKLTEDQASEIQSLIETHGDTQLVKAALASFQPGNPPVFAQAWLGDWRALPAPGELRVVEAECQHHPGQPAARCSGCTADRLAGDR